MKFFSFLVALVLLFGQVTAFSPLYDVLDETLVDLTNQVEQSTDIILDDLEEFNKKTLQVDAYNNLVCLGLGAVTISKNDIEMLSTIIEQRLTQRYDELTQAIVLAESDEAADNSSVIKGQYFNLLDSDIDAFDSSYQTYLNKLSADLSKQLTDNEDHFAKLTISNQTMLQELTTKRAHLATLNLTSENFSHELDEWKTFWSRQVEDVNLAGVVIDQFEVKLDTYFSQQHTQLTALYPELPHLITDLQSFETNLREDMKDQLNDLFEGYLGYYVPGAGDSVLADREEFIQAYYLADGSMNCPVIAGGRQADLIKKIEAELTVEKQLLAETIVAFDGFASNSFSVSLISKQLDAWYADFFATVVKGPYISYKNKALLAAQEQYKADQMAINSVTLPYTKTQLIQALTTAANNYTTQKQYTDLLQASLANIENQLKGNLSAYQKALFTLLHEAITEYLAQ